MKLIFENAIVEIIELSLNDVITTSPIVDTSNDGEIDWDN